VPTHQLFASCIPGLAPLLLQEAQELKLPNARLGKESGVVFNFTPDAMYRSNLWLRTAERVSIVYEGFGARRFDELMKKAGRLPWREHLMPGARVYLRARCRKTRLIHTGAVEERVLAAIEQSLGGRISRVSAEYADSAIRIQVRLQENQCHISLDTSGEPLHRRGYRLAVSKAPLREDLAAALLRFSGWDLRSALVDPMMGSGVIPIEAAMLVLGIAPGLNRSFAFEQYTSFSAKLWSELRTQAQDAQTKAAEIPILGSDRDEGALSSARDNAERAGVLKHLILTSSSLSAAPGLVETAEPLGAVVTNPPYGRRVSQGKNLRPLYQKLGSLVQARKESPAFGLVCGDRKLAYATGIQLKDALATQHGGSRVHLFRRA